MRVPVRAIEIPRPKAVLNGPVGLHAQRSRSANDKAPPAHIKNPESSGLGVLNKCLAVTYSHTANAALPSALLRFTSEFGMGSGGTTVLLPPGKLDRTPCP